MYYFDKGKSVSTSKGGEHQKKPKASNYKADKNRNGGGAMQTDWYEVSNVWYYLCIGSLADAEGVPEGAALKGERFLPSSVGSTTRTQSYYFDYNCGMVEWNYPLPDNSSGSYIAHHVNSRFSEWRDLDGDGIDDDCHNGLDLRASIGTPISAAASGTVTNAGVLSGMGRAVVVRTNVTAPNGN